MNKRCLFDSNIFIKSLKNVPNNEAFKLIQMIFSGSKNDYTINKTIFIRVYYQPVVKDKLTFRQKGNDLWEIINVFFFWNLTKECY
ncbi:hypothetical protein [Persephonella sp.]